MPNLDSLDLGLADKLCAYTLTDSIAEKLRSLSQQVIRNRTRRQDIFDLMLLVDKYPDLDETEKQGILNSLKFKNPSREVLRLIRNLGMILKSDIRMQRITIPWPLRSKVTCQILIKHIMRWMGFINRCRGKKLPVTSVTARFV
jgi:hypothetical protein